MDKSLVMSFLNEEGKKTSLTVNNVKEDLTKEEVKAAMDVIIAKNIFLSKGGDLKAKDSAHVVEKDTKILDVK